ncbi:HAD family hydrolase [Polynucleobacter asymbioticus]|uniref:HAD-superfamily subfamily IB hydrolase, TIGR01490 n=2 Tax=Polynucleobacter asymbioticus TaxID=576611 RepID=A4SZR3_POLAQ|nr:HAD family hydrolase [Polynucleobacter asymbioticus]ABP34977.1 HAD-superfamily subfamily IB hydrolase, TIGR01490 [Polynucleobacter asymbioticus QLW-P1DMWA-1]APB99609.1 phosphoserine phosphatase [Polynucleobacter asymbioticus]APC01915.1 phosphoserine phosphatase [Polynucleobacter asymbioticus]APC06757.1 phosphoserine phosphatase [Polynucleobacter asymbioticus]
MTQLALFDLDHTLLPCDSDYEWGQFLARIGVVDSEYYARQNERFYQDYKEGKLDIHEFLRFALKPLSEHSREQLKEWHDAFMDEVINGQLREQALDLVKRHQDAGDLCCVITATNSFVTRPIVESFGIEHLIATEPATQENNPLANYTGEVQGIPNFREGKIQNLQAWLAKQKLNLDTLPRSYFYSDSMNDLPLLEQVSHPVATNPDDRLRNEARLRNWPILELFA